MYLYMGLFHLVRKFGRTSLQFRDIRDWWCNTKYIYHNYHDIITSLMSGLSLSSWCSSGISPQSHEIVYNTLSSFSHVCLQDVVGHLRIYIEIWLNWLM